MKYIFQFTRILVFCFLGELLHYLLPLPLPAAIYGLILLLAMLKTGILKQEQIQETSTFLIGIFPLLYLPPAVGLMNLLNELRALLIPLFIAAIPVTILVMVITGKTVELTARFGNKGDTNGNH